MSIHVLHSFYSKKQVFNILSFDIITLDNT